MNLRPWIALDTPPARVASPPAIVALVVGVGLVLVALILATTRSSPPPTSPTREAPTLVVPAPA